MNSRCLTYPWWLTYSLKHPAISFETIRRCYNERNCQIIHQQDGLLTVLQQCTNFFRKSLYFLLTCGNLSTNLSFSGFFYNINLKHELSEFTCKQTTDTILKDMVLLKMEANKIRTTISWILIKRNLQNLQNITDKRFQFGNLKDNFILPLLINYSTLMTS